MLYSAQFKTQIILKKKNIILYYLMKTNLKKLCTKQIYIYNRILFKTDKYFIQENKPD